MDNLRARMHALLTVFHGFVKSDHRPSVLHDELFSTFCYLKNLFCPDVIPPNLFFTQDPVDVFGLNRFLGVEIGNLDYLWCLDDRLRHIDSGKTHISYQ